MTNLDIYTQELVTIQGQKVTLSQYKDKVLLIVNTASECGFTYQLEGLEKLQKDYEDKGLVVLGFPCNQFKGQEPGTDSEVLSFCQNQYSVTFPLFSKIEVNGDNTHPLFEILKQSAPGLLGSTAIKWNFTKFIVSRNAESIERFATATKPEKLTKVIEELL